MTLTLIVLILVIGLFCLFAEFFIFPGLTLSGILGGACLVAGVVLGYRTFGYTIGNVIFLSTLVLSGLIFRVGLRKLSSRQFAIHESIDSKVNVRLGEVRVGDLGKSVSALRPGGTAIIGQQRLEVFTRGEFLDAGQPIVVSSVNANRVCSGCSG